MYWLLMFPNIAMARSIKAAADKLSNQTMTVGFSIGLLGLTLGGIYLAVGKQDAASKVTAAILGVIVLALGPSIISFLKGIA